MAIGDALCLCPACRGPTGVQKSILRNVVTLEHGAFAARETVRTCLAECRQPDGTRVTLRSALLAERVAPGDVFGYDVEVHVGIARFLQHRQREEIRADLAHGHGISISTGEISALERRFLDHVEKLHARRAPELRAAMTRDGGYPLHIDATGEDGRGTLFVGYAGWRGWVLGSWKLSTERADQIEPHLRDVIAAFGPPCAIMRDLGRAVTLAAAQVVRNLPVKIPILGCHLHFLKDVGKDLLGPAYDRLREIFRRLGTRSALRSFARDLGRKIGADIPSLRADVTAWAGEDGEDDAHALPTGHAGLAALRALAQWVLDYAQDRDARGFPFERPYLDFARRCATARRALDRFLRSPSLTEPMRRSSERLARLLDPLLSEPTLADVTATLTRRAALLDELRAVLRLDPLLHEPPKAGACAETAATIDAIEKALKDFTTDLRRRRPERGPAQDAREAIDIVLSHLGRHAGSLFGHAITLPPEIGGGIRLVARTNNIQEGFWHAMKRAERRRSGRKVLSRDFECLPPAAALAMNLAHPDYVEIVCGSLDGLAGAFARIDAEARALQRQDNAPAASQSPHDLGTIATASLPSADRALVRDPAFNKRIRAAARSRAPRYAPTKRGAVPPQAQVATVS